MAANAFPERRETGGEYVVEKHLLNRTRSNQDISGVFLIDNVMTTDPATIANKFNTFFADIGVRLSENVKNIHNIHFTDYLLNPSMYNFTFELITEDTTMEILNNLKPKPSCGYDGISTKLLNTCKLEICKSLTLIINQTLSTGIYTHSFVGFCIYVKFQFIDSYNIVCTISNCFSCRRHIQ